MPRLSSRRAFLNDIEAYLESLIWQDIVEYTFFADEDDEEDWNEDAAEEIEDLWEVYALVSGKRYWMDRTLSAGRHEGDTLYRLIYDYPDSAFLTMFRMHRDAFWKIVELLTPHWKQTERTYRGGRTNVRDISMQVAVGLYCLGAEGGGVERHRISLNISYGSTRVYLWRLIEVLCILAPDVIRWPTPALRRENAIARERMGFNSIAAEVFNDCIGYVDGSVIILRDKPLVDHQAYFSRKKEYGFNLQAVCDRDRKFIYAYMGYTAGAHDSRIYKHTPLYLNPAAYFASHEYLLGDKAYAVGPHLIPPFKEPQARRPECANFNYNLSIPRVQIEHAFGILKARFPSLHKVPIRIRQDRVAGHLQVIKWTMGCITLHNLLNDLKDDESWLEFTSSQGSQGSQEGEDSADVQGPSNSGARRDQLLERVNTLTAIFR